MKSKIKGERGDSDVNNISQSHILFNSCSPAQVLCLARCPKVNKRWRWTLYFGLPMEKNNHVSDWLFYHETQKRTTLLRGQTAGRIAICMGKPKNPLGRSNSWCHSVWEEALGNVGCDLRRVNFPLFLVCSG